VHLQRPASLSWLFQGHGLRPWQEAGESVDTAQSSKVTQYCHYYVLVTLEGSSSGVSMRSCMVLHQGE
jgi:hypothetical protein